MSPFQALATGVHAIVFDAAAVRPETMRLAGLNYDKADMDFWTEFLVEDFALRNDPLTGGQNMKDFPAAAIYSAETNWSGPPHDLRFYLEPLRTSFPQYEYIPDEILNMSALDAVAAIRQGPHSLKHYVFDPYSIAHDGTGQVRRMSDNESDGHSLALLAVGVYVAASRSRALDPVYFYHSQHRSELRSAIWGARH